MTDEEYFVKRITELELINVQLRSENGRLRRTLEQCEQSNLTIAKVIERKEDHAVSRQIINTYPTPSGVVVEIREE